MDTDDAHKTDDRRSVSGAVVCRGGTLLPWLPRTKKCVALSTTEAEYVAMADGVKEALYGRGVLIFLMPSLGSPSVGVFEDNSNHINVRYHLLVGGQWRLDRQASPDGRSACGRFHEGYWQREF